MSDLNDPNVQFYLQVNSRLDRLEIQLGNIQLFFKEIKTSIGEMKTDLHDRHRELDNRMCQVESKIDESSNKLAGGWWVGSAIGAALLAIYSDKIKVFFN